MPLCQRAEIETFSGLTSQIGNDRHNQEQGKRFHYAVETPPIPIHSKASITKKSLNNLYRQIDLKY